MQQYQNLFVCAWYTILCGASLFPLWGAAIHCGRRPLCRILDNLPIGMVRMRDDDGEQVKSYERGFPVGFMDVSGLAGGGGGWRS